MKRSVCGLLSMAALSAASSARASHFGSKGELYFEPNALYTQSFESGPAPPSGALVADPSSIHGAQLLRIPAQGSVVLTIPLPPDDVSASFSLYTRGGGAKMELYTALAGPGLPYTGGILFPTGRVTSDGWVEMKSAPLSLPMGRAASLTLTITNVAGQTTDVDGLEVVRDGKYREARPCSPPDASTCDPGDVCAIGYCIDGAAYVPPLPSEADRRDLPAWLGTALYGNWGGVATRPARLPAALATLATVADAPDATTYWAGINAAWQRLHDNHSVSILGFASTDIIPICFVQGDADLSHDKAPSDPVYPDVLVSHGLPGQMAGLVPGDRLVAVNGMPPAAFRRSLVGLTQGNTQSDDPTQYAFGILLLNSDIQQWATDITVVHCDPGTKQCSDPYTIPVASLPTVPLADAPSCDNRPAYHLAGGNPDPVTHDLGYQVFFGALAGTSPSEALYGMMFDFLVKDSATDPWAAPLAAIRQEASGVVLDLRSGYGGLPSYASEITGPFLPASTPLVEGFQEPIFWNQHFTAADGVNEFNLMSDLSALPVGSSDPGPRPKAAVLVTHDVSAHDLLTYAMRGGINGVTNVRSFGTKGCGAFESILRLRWGAGSVILTMGFGDWFTPSGAWNAGTGAEPDEYVVPTQSDLLAGRDTAYERALAWLRSTPGGQ